MSGQENLQNTLECEHMPHRCEKECCPLHHYVSWEREMKNAEYMREDAFRKCNASLVCKSTRSTWAKQFQTYIPKHIYRKCTFLCGNQVWTPHSSNIKRQHSFLYKTNGHLDGNLNIQKCITEAYFQTMP